MAKCFSEGLESMGTELLCQLRHLDSHSEAMHKQELALVG